jgi:tetratricopeptide (TPR) repeat protein
MYMKHFLSILFLVICLASCNSHSAHWDTLSQVESYIEEKPDSALVLLEQINTAELSGKEEKAKHALLYSMALDKNFVDKTDFEVLQPAIDYYEDNGSATDKLRTYYYQGRIYQNMGNDALAMDCFVNAIVAGNESDDILTIARTHFAQSKIYYSLFDWDNFIECNKNAADYFKEAGVLNSYANCLIRIINGYTLKKEPENALHYIEECKRLLSSISQNRLADFYSAYLTYLIDYGREEEIIDVITEYIQTISESRIDWLTISNAYLRVQKYNEILSVLSQYTKGIDIHKDRKYYAVISDAYQNLGEYKKSLEAYEEYIVLSDSIDYAVYTQDTKFVKERHNLELETIKEREAKNRVFLFATIFIILLITILLWIRARLKVNRMEKAFAEQEMEKYRLLYLQMEEERDNLTNLLAQSDELAPDIKTAVGKRLELLNKFFTAFITNNSDIDRTASKEMEELLANKDTFMVSTKLAFAGSHPKFIKYLEDRGLTDWEISYCCLYALGLKGKEVGSYIKMRSHYNNSSEVREKLGINEHDTNLGIYIRKLLKSFE